MRGDNPFGSALEVDPEVEAPRGERHEPRDDHKGGQRVPHPAAADEVERRLPAVEPDERIRALFAGRGSHARRCGDRGHDPASVGIARPRAMPMNLASVTVRLRPSQMTRGRVKKNVVKMSRSVASPKKNAKPLTEPTDRR